MDLEVRHLRMLCAIAEAGSMTKAAAVLGLSQPTLTRQVQRLERFMGGPLFVRERDGVRPTALGEFILVRANSVLPVLDGLAPSRGLAEDEELREIRIGVRPGPLLPSLVRGLNTLHPAAELRTEEGPSSHAVAEVLDSGRLDVALLNECDGYELRRRPSLAYHVVVVEPVFVRLASGHPLAAQCEVSLADLAGEDWATPSPCGNNDDESIYAACGRAGFVPRIRHRVDLPQADELVRSQQAVLLCPPLSDPPAGTVNRPLRDTPLRTTRLLVHHREGTIARQSDKLLRFLVEDYAEQVEYHPVYAYWLDRHGSLS
ncbi:LysR family transcriptional regulator [Crossiella sp. CA-258035]|uniref:LysR family transcriptional regulator n=1 Tax=Crossiella sp. CA-258035 TaxID=2981138 RepID=UPI0024BC013D|nr:LysR family transcriptional regulator [Crossiella sp. CA-258035]WHT22311.1 LysR family transcriptional regulator [Crossiella sp. CA-258035]